MLVRLTYPVVPRLINAPVPVAVRAVRSNLRGFLLNMRTLNGTLCLERVTFTCNARLIGISVLDVAVYRNTGGAPLAINNVGSILPSAPLSGAVLFSSDAMEVLNRRAFTLLPLAVPTNRQLSNAQFKTAVVG